MGWLAKGMRYIYIYIDIYAPSRSGDFCNCLLVYRSLSLSSKGAINAPHNNKSHSYSQSYSFSYRGGIAGKIGRRNRGVYTQQAGIFPTPGDILATPFWRRLSVRPFVRFSHAKGQRLSVSLWPPNRSPCLATNRTHRTDDASTKPHFTPPHMSIVFPILLKYSSSKGIFSMYSSNIESSSRRHILKNI